MSKFQNFIFENPDRVSNSIWWKKSDARTFGYVKNKFFISDKVTNHPDFAIELANRKLVSITDVANNRFEVDRNSFKYPGRLWLNSKVISFWKFPSKGDFEKLIDDLKKSGVDIDDSWSIDIEDGSKSKLEPITNYSDRYKKIQVKQVDHVLDPIAKEILKKAGKRDVMSNNDEETTNKKFKLPKGMSFAQFRALTMKSESTSTVAPTSVASGQHQEKLGEPVKRDEHSKDKIKKKIKKKLQEWTDRIKGGKGDKLKPSDVDQKELSKGIEHEMKEHGFNRHVATEVALDHLKEDPHYYKHLE